MKSIVGTALEETAIEKDLRNKRQKRRLSSEELRILMYSVIMRHAARNFSHRFSVRGIAKDLRMDLGQVSRKIKELSYEMLWIRKEGEDLIQPGYWQVFGTPRQIAEAIPEIKDNMSELEKKDIWWRRNEPQGFKRWYWLRPEYLSTNDPKVVAISRSIEIKLREPEGFELYRELEKLKMTSKERNPLTLLLKACQQLEERRTVTSSKKINPDPAVL